jgi:membrane protease YdiL (CAAX protease family)
MKPATPTKLGQPFLTLLAWGVTLAVSLLPDILFKEFSGELPTWLFWAKIGLLGSGLLISQCWKPLRALRLYFAVVLAVYLLGWGVDRAYLGINYTAWFVGMNAFQRELFTVQIPRITSGGLLVLLMFALTGSFRGFFFVIGKLNAPAAPIPLILTRPPTWHYLGPAIAAAMPLGLIVFAFIFGQPPSIQTISAVLPLLPFILLFAASNAFGEEMLYRASWLAALENQLGKTQALLMTAVYFGIAHFYGVPYGLTGILMAFIPGWLMGKAMLETRGFFWAWFIHLCMDTVIFFFMALGTVTTGG